MHIYLLFFFFITKCNMPISSVHFWAPTFKWGISIANVADFTKPPEKLSYPQQIGMLSYPQQIGIMITKFSTSFFFILSGMSSFVGPCLFYRWFFQFRLFIFLWWYTAVTFTGLIWSRYSTVITPVSLFGIIAVVDVNLLTFFINVFF